MNDEHIFCNSHGTSLPILACQHLAAGPVNVIYFIPADAEYPKQGWCGICEDARIADQGWYDYADSVAQWGWQCDDCFFGAKSRAREVVQVANPVASPETRPED